MIRVPCPECRKAEMTVENGMGMEMTCPNCNRAFDILAFDPPENTGCVTQNRISDTDPACFDHPGKRAEHVCDLCGRLICPLCAFTIAGRRICTHCISSRRNGRPILPLEHRRALYDGLAFRIALWPTILFYFTLFTAPLAIFTAVWNWRKPSSILPRTRIRSIAAILIALMQIVLIVILLIAIATAIRQYGD